MYSKATMGVLEALRQQRQRRREDDAQYAFQRRGFVPTKEELQAASSPVSLLESLQARFADPDAPANLPAILLSFVPGMGRFVVIDDRAAVIIRKRPGRTGTSI